MCGMEDSQGQQSVTMNISKRALSALELKPSNYGLGFEQ